MYPPHSPPDFEWQTAAEQRSDLDFVSEKEKEIVKALKAQTAASSDVTTKECTAGLNNRELVIFLIARKWNIERTIELLKGYKVS